MNVYKVLPIKHFEELIFLRKQQQQKIKEKEIKDIIKSLKVKSPRAKIIIEKLLDIPNLTWSKQHDLVLGEIKLNKPKIKKFIGLVARKKFSLINKIKGGAKLFEALKELTKKNAEIDTRLKNEFL